MSRGECELSFMLLYMPNHVHGFVPLERSPRVLEGKIAHPRLDQPFDKAMILPHQVIQVNRKRVSIKGVPLSFQFLTS